MPGRRNVASDTESDRGSIVLSNRDGISSHEPTRSLSKEQFQLLRKILARYYREAEKCASVRAYYAACIMIGGAFEALLLQICDLFEDEAAEAVSKLPKKQRPKGSIEEWYLNDLIRVAVAAGWLPTRRVRPNRARRRRIGPPDPATPKLVPSRRASSRGR